MKIRKFQKHIDGSDNTEKVLKDTYKALAGNLILGTAGISPSTGEAAIIPENVSNAFPTVADTGPANTEFSLTHNLNRIPVGFICIDQDNDGVYYHSGTAWTTTKIFLKCSAAHVAATIMVF